MGKSTYRISTPFSELLLTNVCVPASVHVYVGLGLCKYMCVCPCVYVCMRQSLLLFMYCSFSKFARNFFQKKNPSRAVLLWQLHPLGLPSPLPARGSGSQGARNNWNRSWVFLLSLCCWPVNSKLFPGPLLNFLSPLLALCPGLCDRPDLTSPWHWDQARRGWLFHGSTEKLAL